jgi:hypothetical protein
MQPFETDMAEERDSHDGEHMEDKKSPFGAAIPKLGGLGGKPGKVGGSHQDGDDPGPHQSY